ncbi:MAG: hypothetical protein JXA67_02205 [Micromonosporaceae bacterium]|nr:hypothetical protein [Micromonosporaceae bacterium]
MRSHHRPSRNLSHSRTPWLLLTSAALALVAANAATVANAATDGIKHPVIIWGNGYGTTTSAYDGLLKHFASHGFIVAAANTTNAGSGTEMLAGIDGIKNVAAISSAADLTRIGATGHSMGGIGSLKAAADKRVRTAFPLEGCRDRPTGLTDKTVAIFQASGDTLATSANAKANCYDKADYAVAFIE